MSVLDTLTNGLFDYAGMFPPASLSFEQALQEAARHARTLRRPGMVATDMVVRSEHLQRLDDETLDNAGWRPGQPMKIALVGMDLDEPDETLEHVTAFNRDHGGRRIPRRIVSVEPSTRAAAEADAGDVATQLTDLCDGLGNDVRVYLEPRWNPDHWEQNQGALIDLLGRLSQGRRVGLKVRCAGETAVTPRTMTDVIHAVVRHKLPLKATQGLHHPIIEKQQGNAWGFLNLSAALRFAGAYGTDLPNETIRAILDESDPGSYTLDDRLGWRDLQLDPQGLQAAMKSVPFTIGSCSIREPDDDLARLFP